jgi:hypothetical protein
LAEDKDGGVFFCSLTKIDHRFGLARDADFFSWELLSKCIAAGLLRLLGRCLAFGKAKNGEIWLAGESKPFKTAFKPLFSSWGGNPPAPFVKMASAPFWRVDFSGVLCLVGYGGQVLLLWFNWLCWGWQRFA